jgi:hypothetical protein
MVTPSQMDCQRLFGHRLPRVTERIDVAQVTLSTPRACPSRDLGTFVTLNTPAHTNQWSECLNDQRLPLASWRPPLGESQNVREPVRYGREL